MRNTPAVLRYSSEKPLRFSKHKPAEAFIFIFVLILMLFGTFYPKSTSNDKKSEADILLAEKQASNQSTSISLGQD